MHMDPAMPQAIGAILLILMTGLALKLLHQPHVVAYLVAGILIGPWGLGVVSEAEMINRIGAMGVVLLLFFVGMETDAKKTDCQLETGAFWYWLSSRAQCRECLGARHMV